MVQFASRKNIPCRGDYQIALRNVHLRIMTEPLVIISRISHEGYDRICRRRASLRAGLRLALAIPAFFLIRAGIHRWAAGQADWGRGLYSATLTELLTGIGLIIGPWQYLRAHERQTRREPMVDRDVEFRFYSDRFNFSDGQYIREVPWREVVAARFSGSVLLIVLRNKVVYYVNAAQMADPEKNFIRTSFAANNPMRKN